MASTSALTDFPRSGSDRPAGLPRVPFNAPRIGERERRYVAEALSGETLQGGGPFTERCHAMLSATTGGTSLLTTSCTAALEMAGLLCDLGPGDEVIMPSYTFSSTANAIVLRGAVPVFVDIRPDTLNIDERAVEAALTRRTKAIFAVHYAGVCAEMDTICELAAAHGLRVVEDAAQAVGSRYRGRPAGALADIGCFSFHATKNIVAGEGGALCTRDAALAERAHILWEKGTNRRQFVEGRVDKYSWVDVGSSFLPSEITAALLLAQLENADAINADRLATWNRYDTGFRALAEDGRVVRPTVPEHCTHNGHMYYLLLPDREARDGLARALAADGIVAPFHYVPLHSAKAGRRFGRVSSGMEVTDAVSDRLIRLPLFAGMGTLPDRVIGSVHAALGATAPPLDSPHEGIAE